MPSRNTVSPTGMGLEKVKKTDIGTINPKVNRGFGNFDHERIFDVNSTYPSVYCGTGNRPNGQVKKINVKPSRPNVQKTDISMIYPNVNRGFGNSDERSLFDIDTTYPSVYCGTETYGQVKNINALPSGPNAASKETKEEDPVQIISDWAEITTLQGCGFIVASQSWCKRIYFICAFLVCFSLTIYQLYGIFDRYLSYPINTQIDLRYENLTFPTITLCNVNPIRNSRTVLSDVMVNFASSLPSFDSSMTWGELMGLQGMLLAEAKMNGSTFNSGSTNSSESISDDVRLHNLMDQVVTQINKTILEAMGHHMNTLLVSCSFDGIACTANDFFQTQDPQYGNCFSFNSAFHRREPFVAHIPGTDSGLSLVLYTQQWDYLTGFTRDSGYVLTIHPFNTKAFPYMNGISLSSGEDINIQMRLVEINRLGGKYGNCSTNDDIVKLYNYSYTNSLCINSCRERYIATDCSCMRPLFEDLYPINLRSLPACDVEAKSATDCKESVIGHLYKGNVSQTSDGYECLRWDSPYPFNTTNDPEFSTDSFPDATLADASNHCRNPDSDPCGPWCNTVDQTVGWGYCAVPLCPATMDCKATVLGTDYMGQLSHGVQGIECQRWDSQYPNTHSQTDPCRYPDVNITKAENYCRNPDDTDYGPWCYTVDPNVRWDYCDIPYCQREETCVNKVLTDYSNNVLDCGCTQACEESEYDVTISHTIWPDVSYWGTVVKTVCLADSLGDNCKDLFDQQNSAFDKATALKNNFLAVEIYYADLNFEVISQTAAFELSSLGSEIGGTVSLWLGITVFTGVEIIGLIATVIPIWWFGNSKKKRRK